MPRVKQQVELVISLLNASKGQMEHLQWSLVWSVPLVISEVIPETKKDSSLALPVVA